jgi:hypothetical protein
MILKKVMSGGQTGVERAGLDSAIEAGIPVGGFCRKGRLAEDGVISDSYPLQELETTDHIRIERNVVESDGTLVLTKGSLSEGTMLACDYATLHLKPCLVVQFDEMMAIAPSHVVRWIRGQQIAILNVAGPRESKFKNGIYREAFSFLGKVFTLLKDDL